MAGESKGFQETDGQEGQSREQLAQELAQTHEKYLRALADLDNFRKRQKSEIARERDQERESIIKDLLPVVDSLERAVTTENASTSPWFEGLMALRRQMDSFLRGWGVERMEAVKGERFNPAWHEAIAALTLPDTPPGIILDIAEPGYKMAERVIRPVRVIVSRANDTL